MNRLLLITLLSSAFSPLLGCHDAPPPPGDKPHVPRATATEIFDLRSKCARLGDKIMEDNVIGPALTQSVVSNYNPQTNRCYVELTVHMADLSKFDEIYFRSVYDGQTGEMLAWARKDKGKESGFFGGVVLSGTQSDYNAAQLRMSELMADDRTQ